MPAYTGQYAFTHLSQYWLAPWHVHDFPQFRQQLIRLRNMLQPKPVTVEIIIYHGRVRLLTFGDMRQQSATTKQIYESRTIRELVEYFDVLLGKHTLLSLERKRCRKNIVFSLSHKFNRAKFDIGNKQKEQLAQIILQINCSHFENA